MATNALPLCASASATAATHTAYCPAGHQQAGRFPQPSPHAVDRFAAQLFARSTLTNSPNTSPALVSVRAGNPKHALRNCGPFLCGHWLFTACDVCWYACSLTGQPKPNSPTLFISLVGTSPVDRSTVVPDSYVLNRA